jgi:hypothetical protein
MGKDHIYIWEYLPGYLPKMIQPAHRRRCARAGAQSFGSPSKQEQSVAEQAGLLKVNPAAVNEINTVDQIVLAICTTTGWCGLAKWWPDKGHPHRH